MRSAYENLKQEVNQLVQQGRNIYLSMFLECGKIDKDEKQIYEAQGTKFVDVSFEYQSWYTKSTRVVSQIIPERLDEFTKLYKGDERRKEVTYMNYSIYDYMLGIQTTFRGVVKRSKIDAIPKMETQWLILSSAAEKFDSSLFDIKEILQADLFDSELDTAKELNKKGFIRAAGAVTGVVLEKHLSHICDLHKIKIRKANPSISEYNQTLKDNNIIDIPNWRFIQRLGDLRNLCDHHKEKEPTKSDTDELISGTEKIIKTVY